MEVLEVFPCGRCGKKFDYLYALKRHGKSCGANKPRKCKKCLKWFDTQLNATRHELRCFNDSTPIGCTFCTKTFEHLYMLQRHYRATHHVKMSALNKNAKLDSGRFIDYIFPDSEESFQDTFPHQEQDTDDPPSVYTIEIESTSNMSDVDSSVQTLVYKIQQTTDLAEIELLPECIISDFDSALQANDIDHEENEALDDNETQDDSYEKGIKVEELLNATEYYGIE